MNNPETSIEVALAKMEGKLDALVAGLAQIREDFHEDRKNHRSDYTALEVRVTMLEKLSYIESGERTGIEKVVKIIYATCALVGFSAIAATLKYIL